jgi:hypothetical protein
MIAGRVEKLKFIAEEMQLASFLAEHVGDPDVARTLARHILIRAENFIAHARGLRRPLDDADYDAREFHRAKEAYATQFEEYFTVARHRLSAHIQDFDFGKRIELWNEIEIIKISFFVDGAREIYEKLAQLDPPEFSAYSEPPELSDPAVLEILHQSQRVMGQRNWVELGTDSLAMTRNNVAPVLNTTPVHARAGQLVLIRRWLATHKELLEKVEGYPRIARILRGRIVTDIASFCDCLVTRPVPPGAPQEMGGLDKLIAANGQSAAPITDFVAASNFQGTLQNIRTIRDRIGAHVEIDPSCTINSLLADSTPSICKRHGASMSALPPPSGKPASESFIYGSTLRTAAASTACWPVVGGRCRIALNMLPRASKPCPILVC